MRDAAARDGDEDVACADYIAGLVTGEGPSRPQVERRVRASVAARTLVGAPGEDRPAADVDQALAFDAFPFAMRAGREGRQLVLRAQPTIAKEIA